MKTAGIVSKAVMYTILALSVLFIALSASEASPMADSSWTDVVVRWAYIVLGIGVVGAVLSAGMQAASDTRSLIVSLVVLAVVALYGLFLWNVCADGTPMNMIGYDGDENTYGWLKTADTSIFVCYTALIGAAIAIVTSEVMALLK